MRALGDNHEEFSFSPERLSTFPTRTLLVWGDRDPYFPVEFALEMYRSLPDARLWVVPDEGHAPVWQSLGGSTSAGRIFPAVVREFFAAAPTPDGH